MKLNQAYMMFFIAVFANAGGVGKTLIVRLLLALFELSNLPVAALDADEGNGLLSHINKDADRLTWGTPVSASKEMIEHYQHNSCVLDSGANMLVSNTSMADLARILIQSFSQMGHFPLLLFPVTPNKPGAMAMQLKVANNLPAGNNLFILNNADSSGNFEPVPSGVQFITLDYLKPGLLEYVNDQPNGSFAHAVTCADPDYRIAQAYIAHWMLKFARQIPDPHPFARAIQLLEAIPTPERNRYTVLRKSNATNDQLQTLQCYTKRHDAVQERGWTANGLREVADLIDRGEI